MPRRYCAHYRNTTTGAARLEICRAANYWSAIVELPRHIYRGDKKYTRQGTPTLYDDNNRGK